MKTFDEWHSTAVFEKKPVSIYELMLMAWNASAENLGADFRTDNDALKTNINNLAREQAQKMVNGGTYSDKIRQQAEEIADMQEQLLLKDKKIDHIVAEAEKIEELLDTQAAIITQLQAVLADWLAFSVDVMPSCAAGADWLDSLCSKTKAAIEKERQP